MKKYITEIQKVEVQKKKKTQKLRDVKDRIEMSQFFKSDLQKAIENIMGAILANTVSENFTELMKNKNI